jgi:hypothetical protein
MTEEEKPFATDLDGPWKDALDFAPELFLKRFLPTIARAIDWNKEFQSLDDELRQVLAQDQEGVRCVDRLLRFEMLSEDPLYLHLEVQCYYDRELGRRVMTYRWNSPVTATSRPSKRNSASSAPRTSACRWNATF